MFIILIPPALAGQFNSSDTTVYFIELFLNFLWWISAVSPDIKLKSFNIKCTMGLLSLVDVTKRYPNQKVWGLWSVYLKGL